MNKKDFTKEEFRILKKLDTPKKIQDFLNSLEINFEKGGDSCMSPRKVLKEKRCHCIEGAIFAALALRFHGKKPLIVDLTATKDDFDHVICVFKDGGKWGCISKSNHSAHRYREPVYRDIRELVMSIFHEYIDKKGNKTLRSYSMPVNLCNFDYLEWWKIEKDLWDIAEHLVEVKHYNILGKNQSRKLRKADKIEIDAGNITQYKEV